VNSTPAGGTRRITAPDLSANPAPRCACVLCLDVSGSMAGAPIRELNEGVRTFFAQVAADEFARFSVEPAVVTFGHGDPPVEVVLPFTSQASGTEPDLPRFTAGGATPLGRALETGLALLEEHTACRHREGTACHQPWMVLMTDGRPTDRWDLQAARVRDLCDARRLVFLGVGVGDGADMNTLAAICPPDRPPQRLRGLRFSGFFEWLSLSMGAVARSSAGDVSVRLPGIGGWAEVENP
jgi:uncharacterized protein YegL